MPLVMTRDPAKILKRKVILARGAILFEDVWAALWPTAMVAGLFVLLALLGVFSAFPSLVRYAIFAAFGLALLFALRPLFKLRMAREDDALRRIEVVSELKHRPATAWNDRLADPNPDPASRTVWQVHRQRAAEQLKNLNFGWPKSRLPAVDPFASRNALAIALIAVGALTWGQWDKRIAGVVNPVEVVAAEMRLDAWIAPPAYTGKPPMLLSGQAAQRQAAGGPALLAPEGSILVVRVSGAKSPSLVLSRPLEDGEADTVLATHELKQLSEGGVYQTRHKLDRPVHASVVDGGSELQGWSISVIPDAPPSVGVTGELALTPSGGFAVPWEASDDYGISSLVAEFKLAGDDAGKVGHGSLDFPAPEAQIALQKLNPKTADGRAFMDFTEHPWAGMQVEMRIRARDQAGQPGVSDPVVFKLPEREFRKLMARSLVEQRRNLVRYPGEKGVSVRAFSGLLAWPEGLIDKSAHYLGLRLVASRLYEAREPEDLKDVVKLMWDLAVSIEDGDLSEALKKLEALRKQLQQALAEGASEERIAELMDQMREALNEYLEAMARQMQEAMKNGQQMQQQPIDPSQMLQSQDLQRMLDMIENLAKSGARDAAQEMLAQLENLMKNLRPGMAQQGNPQANSAMQQMMKQLGEMMQRQQQLMDETFRMPDGQNGQMHQQPGDGQQNRPGQQGDRQDSLANQQGALERMLDQLMQQLNQQGMDVPGGLESSKGAMGEATGALREGDKPNALSRQGEAMDGLREGAQSMARQMQQQGTGTAGNFGRDGEARGNRDDPLGRPRARSGEDFGPNRSMVPNEAAVERARRILW
jgi:uncharacterized protein (TIGR02302 family)